MRSLARKKRQKREREARWKWLLYIQIHDRPFRPRQVHAFIFALLSTPFIHSALQASSSARGKFSHYSAALARTRSFARSPPPIFSFPLPSLSRYLALMFGILDILLFSPSFTFRKQFDFARFFFFPLFACFGFLLSRIRSLLDGALARVECTRRNLRFKCAA